MMSQEKIEETGENQRPPIKQSEKELTKRQVILYSALLAVAITICILSMIGINLFALLIIIGIVLVYVYLDDDIRNADVADSSNNGAIERE